MKIKQTALFLLSAMLLTACGESSVPVQTTPVPETDTTETAAAVTAADTTQQPDTTASSDGTEPAETAAAEETAALTTQTTPQPDEKAPADLRELYQSGDHTAYFSCTGTVRANAGLNLREKPDTGSVSLAKLKKGTAVEISGITITGDPADYEKRWLKVTADGKDGYVCSNYVLADVTTPYADMSEREVGAMGILLYYQSMWAYGLFMRQGGIEATGYADENNPDGFIRLTPDGMTLDGLLRDFHRYFTSDFDNDLRELYQEQDGALWTVTGYGDNISLQTYDITEITAQSETEISYQTREVWAFPGSDLEEEHGIEYHPFRLVYEDGRWKCAELRFLL